MLLSCEANNEDGKRVQSADCTRCLHLFWAMQALQFSPLRRHSFNGIRAELSARTGYPSLTQCNIVPQPKDRDLGSPKMSRGRSFKTKRSNVIQNTALLAARCVTAACLSWEKTSSRSMLRHNRLVCTPGIYYTCIHIYMCIHTYTHIHIYIYIYM